MSRSHEVSKRFGGLVVDGFKNFGETDTRELSRTVSSNVTLVAADVGKLIKVVTDGVVITLPSTVVGYTYTFVNYGEDGTVGFNISPAAADKVFGAGITSADNKDYINTKITAQKGDLVTIVGDGVDGWLVTRQVGTWAREA